MSVARGTIVKTGSSFVRTSGLHTALEYFVTSTTASGYAVWDFYDSKCLSQGDTSKEFAYSVLVRNIGAKYYWFILGRDTIHP